DLGRVRPRVRLPGPRPRCGRGRGPARRTCHRAVLRRLVVITDFDDPEFEFTAIADRQGWSTTSRLDVALSFISSRELGDQLAMFAAGARGRGDGRHGAPARAAPAWFMSVTRGNVDTEPPPRRPDHPPRSPRRGHVRTDR